MGVDKKGKRWTYGVEDKEIKMDTCSSIRRSLITHWWVWLGDGVQGGSTHLVPTCTLMCFQIFPGKTFLPPMSHIQRSILETIKFLIDQDVSTSSPLSPWQGQGGRKSVQRTKAAWNTWSGRETHTKDRVGKFLRKTRPNKFLRTWEIENGQ